MVWKLLSNKGVRTALYVALALVAGMILNANLRDPKVVERVIENTKIVMVEVPVLSEKIVTKYLTDPKDKAIIVGLLAQNDKLKVEVASLSQTIAELKQSGGTDTGGTVTPPTPENPSYTYKDFQLTALYQGEKFDYTLHQTFEVLSTTGRDKDGNPVGLTNVFQIGRDGERIPIPAKTTVIFADHAAKRWMVSPRIQAGVGAVYPVNKGGVVALQWLKRGKSKAPEDISFSVLSPAVLLGQEKTLGLLPFSWNLGSLPHQPFTNIWVSPFISQTSVGATLTATF